MKLKTKLIEFLSLDHRSLALMRICAGLVIIFDLLDRARSLTAHYTDAGVLPRADVLAFASNKFFISLHMLSGLPSVEIALFIIAGIFALMLVFGYRTRIAIVASWFLLISLHARNPEVLQGGDVVLRVTLFWMMFLPIEKSWSLDRLLNYVPKAKNKTTASAATLAYIVQIVLVYVMSGVLKTGAAWHDGTAVYYALSVDQLVRPLGEHLRTLTGVTRFLTYGSRNLELYGSLLYFSPFATGFFRTLGVLLFALMQIGFNLSMHLGLFGAIAITVTLGLLPSYFWDVWYARATAFFRSRARPGLAIYYDTNCGFCFKMVHVLKHGLLLSADTTISPSNTDPAIAQLMAEKNSWVVIDKTGKKTFGFAGVATVFSYSPLLRFLAPIMRLPLVRHVGEYVYRQVAKNRLLVCLPETEEVEDESNTKQVLSLVRNGLVIFLMLYVIVWNVDPNDRSRLLVHREWIGWTTRLDQAFNMFAPTPLTEDGWYVIPAKLQDGREIDIFKDGPMLTGTTLYPVSYAKPAHIADGYPDQRWQKYLMNLAEAGSSKYRLSYGTYLCRTWNATHADGETLETFDMIFMIENTPPPGAPATPPVRTVLWSHHCF